MHVVRSVSGTWHEMVREPEAHEQWAQTTCHRFVKMAKVMLEWDGRRWPGVKTCRDCHAPMSRRITEARAERKRSN